MIAALPMYDRPETARALDRLWQGVRAQLGYGPEALTRGGDPWEVWRDPELVLGQTCSLPYRQALHGEVTLIGAGDHRLPGCPPGSYYSVIIARAADARLPLSRLIEGRLAYNDALSQSGWAALWAHLDARDLRPNVRRPSGGHLASARMVATGEADYAAIDAVTWALITRSEPIAAGLAEVVRTRPTPALPFITAAGADADAIAEALSAAISGATPEDRAVLHLHGLIRHPASAYLALATPPPPD